MRTSWICVFALVLIGCSHQNDQDRDLTAGDKAAREAGKAAHEVSKGIGKAAAAGARELGHAAKEAHEGWKEAGQKDKAIDRDKERQK
jgi:hypothetical protein